VEIVNSPSLNPAVSITLEAWYKPVSFRGTGNDPIIDKGYYGDYNLYYQYHLGVCGDTYPTAQSRYSFYIANTAVQNVHTINNFWVPNVWYHIVGTYDGTTEKLFVNGVLLDSRTVVSSMNDFGKVLRIGKFTNRNECLPGTIDELRISSSTRYADWVLTEYQNQNNPLGFFDIDLEEAHP